MKVLYSALATILLVTLGCGEDDVYNPCAGVQEFDQTGMLTNYADEIIVPTFVELQELTDRLVEDVNTFAGFPSTETLTAAQTTFREAYALWQHAAVYSFGPAESIDLVARTNPFPTNAERIDAIIASDDDADLNFISNSANSFARGFPALDYLLFDGDEATVVDRYHGQSDSQRRGHVAILIALNIEADVKTVTESWQESYRDQFIANTGTAAGSSLSLLVNGLNEHYENIKRDKLGIPSGIVTAGIPNPTKTEAFYSGISVALAEEALRGSSTAFTGGMGIGLDDLLLSLDARTADGEPLTAAINAIYDEAVAAVSALPDPLSETIGSDLASVNNAYAAATRNVVRLKTDMPSALCVDVTYIDNPSDTD